MSDKGLHNWLNKQNGGQLPEKLSEAEREELARYDRLWEAAAPPASRMEVDTDAAWAKLDDRLFGDEKIIPLNAKKSASAGQSRFNLLRIAAALILLAVAAFTIVGYLNEPASTVLAFHTTDKVEEIALPDGSKISLNVNSELTYTEGASTRQVELLGEAFFDVARNEEQPFVITTGDLTTTVLGTSFNIRAYPDQKQEVSVKSGKVAVAAAEEKVILVKKEKVVYEPEQKKLTEKEDAIVDANVWQTRKLEFEDVKLGDILPVLEAYYGKKFIASEAIINCKHSVDDIGAYSLDKALDLLSFTWEVEMEQKQDTVFIRGDRCK